jgi:hypothetical protein
MKELNPNEKQKVEYCVPLWVRDHNIKNAISRVKDRVQEYEGKHSEPIAIVCYGPSLAETWEKVRDFKYVMTCSGAHRFLIEKGIVPTWHVEVDPRAHKVELIGPPHENVEYLIASACHPKIFDHLNGFNVKLWHVFGVDEDAMRLLPPEEWALTGGCSAGLRCLVLARFLGFTDFHIFGMDGSEGATGKHAAAHPNQAKTSCETTVNGKKFLTTPGFLEAARSTGHELDQLKDVTATFYGEGLTQELMKNHVSNKSSSIIAVQKPYLITDSYRELNQELHRTNPFYGASGARHAVLVQKIAEGLKTTSVLDYGCGKGHLGMNLPFPIWEYDPAIPGKEQPPKAADIVVCTDVLEHIEPDNLYAVLDDLRRVTRKVGYFVVHLGPAIKTLPDGRNTHLIQRSAEWWRTTLAKFFTLGKVKEVGSEVHFIVGALAKPYKSSVYIKKEAA